MRLHFEIVAMDPDLGVIVKATDLDTGATCLGASDPATEADLPEWLRSQP